MDKAISQNKQDKQVDFQFKSFPLQRITDDGRSLIQSLNKKTALFFTYIQFTRGPS